MASGAVTVKLTILNKAAHLDERDTLNGKYEKLGTRIQVLETQHKVLKELDTTNITLDDALTILDQYQNLSLIHI